MQADQRITLPIPLSSLAQPPIWSLPRYIDAASNQLHVICNLIDQFPTWIYNVIINWIYNVIMSRLGKSARVFGYGKCWKLYFTYWTYSLVPLARTRSSTQSLH